MIIIIDTDYSLFPVCIFFSISELFLVGDKCNYYWNTIVTFQHSARVILLLLLALLTVIVIVIGTTTTTAIMPFVPHKRMP